MTFRYVLLFSVVMAAASAAQAQPDTVKDFWKELTRCSQDSDCGSAVEVWPACHHACGTYKYDQCDGSVMVCPAYNRKAQIMANCAVNAPCRPPKRVWCDHGNCRSE